MAKVRIDKRRSTILLRDVPVDLRDHFKAWCIINGTNMTAKIIDLMKGVVKEADNAVRRGVAAS